MEAWDVCFNEKRGSLPHLWGEMDSASCAFPVCQCRSRINHFLQIGRFYWGYRDKNYVKNLTVFGIIYPCTAIV